MAKKPHIFIISLLLAASLLEGSAAVRYNVTNTVSKTPGGIRFNTEIGVSYTLETVKSINLFIWELFKQNSDGAQRKNVPILNVVIKELNHDTSGETGGDNIYINEFGIQSFGPGKSRARFEFTALMYHETTHIFQWSGEGTAPGGLTEGIADYVVMKSKYFEPEGYTKPGEGSRWDEGYGVTARFLEYCDSLSAGFTADLNNKMRKVYTDKYFYDLLGNVVNPGHPFRRLVLLDVVTISNTGSGLRLAPPVSAQSYETTTSQRLHTHEEKHTQRHTQRERKTQSYTLSFLHTHVSLLLLLTHRQEAE